MPKSPEDRPDRQCDSHPALRQDEARHKIRKHHSLRRCPMCRYREKRLTQFNKSLGKARRGLRASSEARRIDKGQKKLAVALADCLEKSAIINAPAPSTPPFLDDQDLDPFPTSSTIPTRHYHTTSTSPITNFPLSPPTSEQSPKMKESNTYPYKQEYDAASEASVEGKGGFRRLSISSLLYTPPTPTGTTYMNIVGGLGQVYHHDAGQTKLLPRKADIAMELDYWPSFLAEDIDRHWDQYWDMAISYPVLRAKGCRIDFENNEDLYDASLAYLLNFNPLSC